MSPIDPERQAALASLCRRFRVARLEVFGSAARGEFVRGRSDVDLLAAFEPMPGVELADAFFGFREAASELLGCPVDLLTPRSVENPALREQIDAEKDLLHAA